jgi:hypothetical protein
MSWWESVPELDSVDVLVVGSGSAGSTAAISAARLGANTMLIEKLPFLGGTSTAVLDTFYGFYTPGEHSKKIVGGVPDDVIAGLRKYGKVVERPNTYGAGTGVTYNSEHLKLVWEELAGSAGVRVLQHVFLQDVKVRDGRVEQVLIATKAGLRRVKATVFIDTSGDADLCAFAGFGFELAGDESPAQSLTTTFKVVNVDIAERKTISKDKLHELMGQACGEGYELPRREGSDHITPIDHMIATVMTRLPSTSGTKNALDPDFITAAEHGGRRQAHEYFRFLKDMVPGYANSDLVAFSTQIGVRETRRVYGDYRLTREDVLSARQFDDQIGLCGAPIEDHRIGEGTDWVYILDGASVGIPLSSLIVRDSVNTLVAGRCFSATHDAHASVRSMAQCMAMGQAVGTLAANAVATQDVRLISAAHVQDQLAQSGAVIKAP